MNGISVCIPVRNEQNCIEKTVRSVLNQDYKGKIEILVCANACSDHTESIVLSLSMHDERIRLLNSHAGKPSAWNRLIEESQYNSLVFMDGDVQISNNALSELELALYGNPDYAAATPRVVKVMEGFDLISKGLQLPAIWDMQTRVNGQLYILDKAKFIARMWDAGYKSMPTDIINEDEWVGQVLMDAGEGMHESRHVGRTSKAEVYTVPPRFYELPNYLTRVTKGSYQLKVEHPMISSRFVDEREGRGYYAKIKDLLSTLGKVEGIMDKALAAGTFPLKKVLWRHYTNQGIQEYKRGETSNLWNPVVGSKQGIPIRRVARQ